MMHGNKIQVIKPKEVGHNLAIDIYNNLNSRQQQAHSVLPHSAVLTLQWNVIG